MKRTLFLLAVALLTLSANAQTLSTMTVKDNTSGATVVINTRDMDYTKYTKLDGTIDTVDVSDNVGNHSTTLYFNSVVVGTTDNTTNGGCGSITLYTFPQGLIHWRGAIVNATITGTGSLTSTAAFVNSLGTTGVSGTLTLTSTNANLISSGTSTLSSGTVNFKNQSSSTSLLDGTTSTTSSTPLVIKGNFACPDAGSSGAGTLTLTGKAIVNWANLGDK